MLSKNLAPPFQKIAGKVNRQLLYYARRATCRARSAPTAIIIGAQKAGTSSLFSYLIQHPQIVGSFRKEVHFFDGGLVSEVDNYQKGIGWYLSHFPVSARNKDSHVIEATPSYLFVQQTAERIHTLLPGCKLIIILRDPTERAISNYFHERRAGREHRSAESALLAPPSSSSGLLSVNDDNFLHKIWFSYKERGIYFAQIRNYLNFFRRESICILGSKELFEDPHLAARKVFEFLGISVDSPLVDTAARNVNPGKSAVSDRVRVHLDEFFLPHSTELRELLGSIPNW